MKCVLVGVSVCIANPKESNYPNLGRRVQCTIKPSHPMLTHTCQNSFQIQFIIAEALDCAQALFVIHALQFSFACWLYIVIIFLLSLEFFSLLAN